MQAVLVPLNYVTVQAQLVLPPNWEGMQAGQALILRQAILVPPPGKECRQGRCSLPGRQSPQQGSSAGTLPRQAVLPLSQGTVQAMQVLIPRQVALTPSPICWEGVQAVQVLFPRQTRVSVLAKAPLVLQQGTLLFH